LRAEIKISGIVQGVGFRPFVYRIATKNGLVGYVRNRGDAYVEVVVEGSEESIQRFLFELKNEKPPQARIHEIITNFMKEKNEFADFNILKSSDHAEFSGSVIPPDIAICEECSKELRDPQNPRYNYFFITCTNCGPRFTIVERLPYDRPNTTMRDFKMCSFCLKEYMTPDNRRFHAQTVACPNCGPKAYLTTNNGEPIQEKNAITEAGKLLEEGFIVAIKGYGGFHVATATTISKPIMRLRKIKFRHQKPFAIMARDLETIKTFAQVSDKEIEMLVSPRRPIVLLKKNIDFYLSEMIAPKLHNIGVMLPYTGLHMMLFDEVKEPAFVMTSANPPNEPIVKDNSEALKKLGSIVDYFLFHNRRIFQRCDDSVIRVNNNKQCLIRRSRGYAPEPVKLSWTFPKFILGLGAEENVVACILSKDKAFLSQHIGDVENIETLTFLREVINHLLKLTNSEIDAVACDMHPKFNTTRLANEFGQQLNVPIIKVQHHYAHIAALMGEFGIEELIGISCDGYGYGTDNKAWGGEILYCKKGEFKRLGHLQEQPMIGGDLATRYPLRMAAGILKDVDALEEWLLRNSHNFPHGAKEVKTIINQIEKGSVTTTTTSCGRLLDAVSAILGICYERSYEGEPAMKLESAAIYGTDILKLEPNIRDNVIDTTYIVEEVFENREKFSVADLALSAQSYIARSLAQLALNEAEKLGVGIIGFSGGVAHNEYIVSTIRKIIEENGLRFLAHETIPPGDGGISFGQVVAAAWQLE